MKRWFLAAALLLLSAGLASADYVIIVANIGVSKELKAQQGYGMAGMQGGMRGGMAGMQGGMAGMQGGMRGGMAGMQGGMAGMQGGMAGMRGGMAGMQGGMAGMQGGMRGGMAGMQGGMMGMGMRGGMRGGMMGMMGMMNTGPTDVDDVPYFIVAVVEVEPSAGGNLYKKLSDTRISENPSAKVKHKWGGSTLLHEFLNKAGQTIVLTKDADHKPLRTVLHRFNDKFAALFKDNKPTAEALLELADWTLAHGLVDKLPQVMDKLVEIDKSHPAAVAYLKVKAELDRPPTREDASTTWRKKLLSGYKVSPESDRQHYVLVHNWTPDDKQIQSYLDLLENSFRGYYYWFALKGVALPVPKQRQLAVVTAQPRDFHHFHKILTSGPVVVDGFFARRENVAVMANKRQDDTYDSLNKFWKKWEDHGFQRTAILSGKKGVEAGHPRAAAPDVVAEAQMVALMLKALEQEAELATISHDASRQQLFTSGLLPRNVAAPEWLLFGMGSFFETPLQSPWAGIGAPSAYYLPRWHEMKTKALEKSPGETLRKVITDAYFRAIPLEGESETPLRHAHDAALRKARTSSWALTYFLAKDKTRFRPDLKKSNQMDGLGRYFEELSKMPRDIELDDEVLLGCFARAFGCVDAGNNVDKGKLDSLARAWYAYMENVKFDSETIMKQIREVFRERLKQSQAQGRPAPAQPNGAGGFPPGG